MNLARKTAPFPLSFAGPSRLRMPVPALPESGTSDIPAAVPERRPRGENIGEIACSRAWERIRRLAPASWLDLPAAQRQGAQDPAFLLEALTAAGAPHPAIASEVEHALLRGAGNATALALVTLGALAHARYGGGEAALALARAGLQRAARRDDDHAGLAHAVHAALLMPANEGFARAAAVLAGLCHGKSLAPIAGSYLYGAALVAGMPVPELAHHLEMACRQALAGRAADAAVQELEYRASLLRGLLSHQGGTILERLCTLRAPGQESRFGHWLTRLQAAWYAGEHALALRAVEEAGALVGPLSAPGDLLVYHVFAVLALSRCGDPFTLDALRRHGDALAGLDTRCRASHGAMAALADAAFERRRGQPLGALRGFERAAALATGAKLHWLAVLACEQAAELAEDAGLGSAAHQYRQQTLLACRRWGALGRLEALRARWNEAPQEEGGCDLGQSVAHELNQPLAAVALHAAAAAKWLRRAQPDVERALDSLALIGAAGRQAGNIVRGLQRLAAGMDMETDSVVLDRAVRETVQLLRRLLRKHGIELDLVLGLGERSVEANRVQLQQVLTNLVVNAAEAHAAAGLDGPRRIRIETVACGGHAVELAVSDNGPGIAPAHRERLFTSMFSTKRGSSGNGMGLSISLSIARAHGGHIWYEPCAPRGACFRLRLPV
jgi:signal transduction histidine kinase